MNEDLNVSVTDEDCPIGEVDCDIRSRPAKTAIRREGSYDIE